VIIVVLGDGETWDLPQNATLHTTQNVNTDYPDAVSVGVTVQELYDFWLANGGEAVYAVQS